MQTVRLNNGTMASRDRALMVFKGLVLLFKKDEILFIELVFYCLDPKPDCFGRQKQTLVDLELADTGGNIDEITRNIVISSVEGKESMTLRMPFRE
mgnify:CR=1 FL=1